MDRINNISGTVSTYKPKTLEKQVPKSQETTLQQQINSLLPNDLHNLENPSIYLEQRRSDAKVNHDKLKSIIMDPFEEVIQNRIVDSLVKDPEVQLVISQDLTLEQNRLYTNQIFAKSMKALNMTTEEMAKDQDFYLYAMGILTFIHGSSATKLGVQYGLYVKTITKLGTEKHQVYAERGMKLQDMGCFGLTELGHGSNVQGILTTATYSHSERSFILNTPHELGMKYWIGNLAKTANYAVVFAKLIVTDRDEGVHAFLVKVRDDKGNLLPGVQVGDIGHKLGQNGVDNGWVMFRRVKLPYDALLDKYSSIDDKGELVSPIKNKTDRFALQLGALSAGRLVVSYTSGLVSLTVGNIALRYLTVRKQFGSKKFQEETLITYPLVQSRLVPIMAVSLIQTKFTENLYKEWERTDVSKVKDKRVKELHALSSYIKAAASWDANTALLVIRELCGGHGYSSYSRIPDYIADQNVQSTWEGTNDVLIQQTAKFILKVFSKYVQKGVIDYASFSFIKDFEDTERTTKEMKAIVDAVIAFDPNQSDIGMLLMCFKRLLQYKLKSSSDIVSERFAKMIQEVQDSFTAFNKALPNAIMHASCFYGEYKLFEFFDGFIAAVDKTNSNEIAFLKNLLAVFGITKLRSEAHYLSEHAGLEFFKKLDELSLHFNNIVINDLVVLGDIITPPDVVLNSSLGSSDGDVYRNIISKIYSNGKNFGKSENWTETLKIRGFKKSE